MRNNSSLFFLRRRRRPDFASANFHGAFVEFTMRAARIFQSSSDCASYYNCVVGSETINESETHYASDPDQRNVIP